MAYLPAQKLSAKTSAFTYVVPSGHYIQYLMVNETAGNSITGGLKVGTTSGGVDVVIALTVAGSSLQIVPDATLLKRLFSTSASQTLFFDAVTLWNSASIDVYIQLGTLQ